MSPFQHANADVVTADLLVGGDLHPDDDRAAVQAIELVDAGVTHVLDVRQEWDDSALWDCVPEVSYFWHGVDDAGQRIPEGWFDTLVVWAKVALARPGARLLVHCHMGINRGPSAAYAVLLAQGWDVVDALQAIRDARPIANIAYAHDALRWYHAHMDAGPTRRRHDRERVDRWMRENAIDVATIIRRIRQTEAS